MRSQGRWKALWTAFEPEEALLRGIVTALLENQRIETTVAKAKEAKRIAERMISFGIKGISTQSGRCSRMSMTGLLHPSF